MTDREWAVIAPLLPPPKPGGRPRRTDLRAVMDAILYIASGGCQWRMLPKDFPPRSTVQGYFYRWRDGSLFDTINHVLVLSTRDLEGRDASPTAGVIDIGHGCPCDWAQGDQHWSRISLSTCLSFSGSTTWSSAFCRAASRRLHPPCRLGCPLRTITTTVRNG